MIPWAYYISKIIGDRRSKTRSRWDTSANKRPPTFRPVGQPFHATAAPTIDTTIYSRNADCLHFGYFFWFMIQTKEASGRKMQVYTWVFPQMLFYPS